MTERLGDRAAHEVVKAHNAIVREQVRVHEGAEVELQGDGFLLAFGDVRRGLACAIAIQRAFAAYSAAHPGQPIRVRIGLHTGEAIQEADRFFGKTVILAARIAAQARGREILVSAATRDAAGDAAIRFGAPRELGLKGLAGMYALYPVGWAEDGSTA
jgi:class 3 adenylate cyclase